MKIVLFCLCAIVLTAAASPFRPHRERDWSKIKFKTPKVPPHTLQFVGKQQPVEPVQIPANTKNFKEVCGINGKSTESRIVGGVEAVPHQWPWQVGIYIDDMYFCGGQLISDEYVLTAAHCTDGASFFDIILGAHHINDASAETEYSRLEVRTTTYTQHASYNSWFISNDVSVIRLPAPVTFTPEISPVCLPTADDVGNTFVGDLVTATGWGRPSDSTQSISPVLRQVNVPVLDNESCNAIYGIVTAGNICIDASGGKGTCNGDSGGPLVHKNGDGSWKTLGITSFGSSAGCEVGYPDAFTRVTAYLDWIAANTGVLY